MLAAKLNSFSTDILAAYSGWDAMHGNSPWYIRMMLSLVDKVLNGGFKQQLLPVPASASRSSKRPRSDSPLFPGAVCTKTDTPARTTSPASLLVVHVAASPALVATNQTSPTPMEETLTAAPKSPDPDTTSAAPAPVSAGQLLQPLLRRAKSTSINSSHSLSFLFCKK